MLNEKILFQKSVVVSDAIGNRKNAWENELISVIRILDSRRENFKLSKAYESKVDVRLPFHCSLPHTVDDDVSMGSVK